MKEERVKYDYYEGWLEVMKEDYRIYNDMFNPEMGRSVRR